MVLFLQSADSCQADQRQDCHDHDDEAHEIDDTAHLNASFPMPHAQSGGFMQMNAKAAVMFRRRQKNRRRSGFLRAAGDIL